MSNTIRRAEKKKQVTPRIMIGIPSNRPMPKETVASLLELSATVGARNVVMMQNAMINQCRDAIVKIAIERNYDYIFWMDDDMIIPPDTISRLLAHNKDICSGLYFGRGNFRPLLFDVNVIRDKDNLIEYATFEQHLDYPQNKLFKIGGIGFGCVLTKVSVMKAMMEEWGTCFDFLFGKGEDLSFAVRCEDMGVDTWADSSIRAGHIGQLIVTENHWNAVKDSIK